MVKRAELLYTNESNSLRLVKEFKTLSAVFYGKGLGSVHRNTGLVEILTHV